MTHDIICIQESRLGQFKNFNVTGFKTLYNRNGHGQSIIVRDHIQHSNIDVSRWASENLYLQAIKVDNQPISNVVNVYACNRVVNEEEWKKLGDMETTLPGTTIFCGDFNARGTEWGNTITNPQGIALENALDVCNLQCLNDGSMTRRAMRENDSDGAIDLALVSLQVADKCQWKVLAYEDNDHAPCGTLIRRNEIRQTAKRIQAFKYSPEGNEPVSKLRISARPSRGPSKTEIIQPPWWNDELQVVWHEKRNALKRLTPNLGNQVLRAEERKASKTFQAAAEEAKSTRYENFCAEISDDKALHKFWEFHRAMNNKKKVKGIPDFETEDRIWVRKDDEKGEALFQRYLRQTDQKNEDERKALLYDISAHYEATNHRQYLSPNIKDNVKNCIKYAKNTAPGPDGVRYTHMKSLEDNSIQDLAEVLEKSLFEGEIPEDWLDSHLCPLPKPEKDPTKIASYRVITMQNTVGKLLEKIVAHKLATELEEKDLLPPTLGSYRKRKDTWMNAAVLASDVYDGFERGEETLVAALDLEDAYNRVQFSVTMKTLVNLEVNPRLSCGLVGHFLRGK